MTHGSLFAGIGGFDLGFERAGFETVWQVEIDEYCRRVLERHFPRAERFGDIRECGSSNLRRVDCITGGFPCQPFSHGGKRLGEEDDRYLWPEMFRIVRALRPAFVVAENVFGLVTDFEFVLDQVYADLEGEGYGIIPPVVVPACAFGAWHRRDRVWICAHLDEGICRAEQGEQQAERSAFIHRSPADDANTNGFNGRSRTGETGPRKENRVEVGDCDWWATEPGMGRVVHGLPGQLDKHRISALGNAVVPQIAQWIAERIKAVSL